MRSVKTAVQHRSCVLGVPRPAWDAFWLQCKAWANPSGENKYKNILYAILFAYSVRFWSCSGFVVLFCVLFGFVLCVFAVCLVYDDGGRMDYVQVLHQFSFGPSTVDGLDY